MSSDLVTSLAEHTTDIPNMSEAMKSVEQAFVNGIVKNRSQRKSIFLGYRIKKCKFEVHIPLK